MNFPFERKNIVTYELYHRIPGIFIFCFYHMYKKILFGAITAIAIMQSNVFAATTLETYDPTLQAATSCADVEATMKDYLK
jgi:hypothetical protein